MALETTVLSSNYFQHSVAIETLLKENYALDFLEIDYNQNEIKNLSYVCTFNDGANDKIFKIDTATLRTLKSNINNAGSTTQAFLKQFATIKIIGVNPSDYADYFVAGFSSFKVEMVVEYYNGNTETTLVFDVDYLEYSKTETEKGINLTVTGSKEISVISEDIKVLTNGVRQLSESANKFIFTTSPIPAIYPSMAISYINELYLINEINLSISDILSTYTISTDKI